MRALLLSTAFALTTAGCHMGLFGVLAGSSEPGMYNAGDIARALGPGSVRTLGCLDIGLVLVDRPSIDTSFVQLDVGNRCGHPEAHDFARVRIDGVRADGDHRAVALVDPRHEIVELRVGAGEHGRELVKLDTAADLVALSFDVDAIAPDAPHAHPSSVQFTRAPSGGPWTSPR